MNIRYEGILFSLNPRDSTIALQSVRCLGTEGRVGGGQDEIPASDEMYPYLVFHGRDIKDLQVHESAPPVSGASPKLPRDPAIVRNEQKPAPPTAPSDAPSTTQAAPQQAPTQGGWGESVAIPSSWAPTITDPKPAATSADGDKAPEVKSDSPQKSEGFRNRQEGQHRPYRGRGGHTRTWQAPKSEAPQQEAQQPQTAPEATAETSTAAQAQAQQQGGEQQRHQHFGGRGRRPPQNQNRSVAEPASPLEEFDFSKGLEQLSIKDKEDATPKEVVGPKYDKSKDFFDDLSSDRREPARNRIQEYRQADAETFGAEANSWRFGTDRGGNRGGGGGYRGHRGGGGRGGRGGGYRGRGGRGNGPRQPRPAAEEPK